MKIIIAPQTFKGTASAEEVAFAMAKGVTQALPNATLVLIPIADGGDGTLTLLMKAKDGIRHLVSVKNSRGRNHEIIWGSFSSKPPTAVIELARICGLSQLSKENQNPLLTTTYGVGQAIIEALNQGFRRIVIGLGGSSTNDAGTGMAAALGVKFLDSECRPLPLGGGFLGALHSIDISEIDPRLKETEIIALCDVTNPLTGQNGATRTYASQKGATPKMVDDLEAQIKHFADIAVKEFNMDIKELIHGGAAGGTASALHLFTNTSLEPGADWILNEISFSKQIANADLVIVGEGQMDEQTSYNKAPLAAAKLASLQRIPVLAIVGQLGPTFTAGHEPAINAIIPISSIPLKTPPANALEIITTASEEATRNFF